MSTDKKIHSSTSTCMLLITVTWPLFVFQQYTVNKKWPRLQHSHDAISLWTENLSMSAYIQLTQNRGYG